MQIAGTECTTAHGTSHHKKMHPRYLVQRYNKYNSDAWQSHRLQCLRCVHHYENGLNKDSSLGSMVFFFFFLRRLKNLYI